MSNKTNDRCRRTLVTQAGVLLAVLVSLTQASATDEAWYLDYKPLAEIEEKLQSWATAFPDLVTLVDIGDSFEGRDIWALRISGSDEIQPGVLFNGTQHAREWISPMVNMYIADQLVTGYESDPEIQSMLDAAEIFVVPVVNPDGYEYSWTDDRDWRKNRRDNGNGTFGVDLNRNWDAHFGGPFSTDDSRRSTYRGTGPFSEPETQALSEFITAHPQIVAGIDYHAYSEYILSPVAFSVDEVAPDQALLDEIAIGLQAEIAAVNGVTYEAGTWARVLYEAGGTSIDWAYEQHGILAYTIELRPFGFIPGFELPADQIIPTAEENFAGALYLINRSIAIGVPEPSGVWLLTIGLLAIYHPSRKPITSPCEAKMGRSDGRSAKSGWGRELVD